MARVVVSQTDRLLLHLLDMEAYREEPEVPLGASQEGIAQRLGTQVHNASRTLSAMEAEGLVTDRLAHVRGAPKRRRAYFLTDRGHKAANKIREDLLKTKVAFEDRGQSENIALEEAVKRIRAIAGTPPGLFDLVEVVRTSGVIRSSELTKTIHPPGSRGTFIEAAVGRPKVSSFFGRENELKELTEFLKGDGSVMLVWGIPGIGKTSLASKLFDDASGSWHQFWYSIHTWDTEEHFMTVLSKFLESAGQSSFASEMRRGGGPSDLFGPLVTDLTALRTILYLDDVQKAQGRLARAVSVLIEAARTSESCKMIMMSRELPQYFSKTDVGNSTLELSWLDSASARALARSSKAEDPERTADASRGHPLLLSLMARSGPGESRGDVISFIEKEVSMSLSPSERSVLETLSVYRHPVPPEAVADDAGDTLVHLKDRALVIEQEQGLWTHDILREFFISRMGQDSRASHHGAAAAYCESREGADWRLESLHHYVEASDFDSARRVALGASSELSSEFPQETLNLLSRLPSPGTSEEDVGIMMLMGQLSEELGDDVSAARHYEMCLEALPKTGRPAERAMALEALGRLKTRVEQWTESFSAHEKALTIYQKNSDVAGQIREWLNIGGAHRMRADYVKAREAYSEALSLASTREDRSAQAACLNNLALLEWDEGSLKQAELRLKESIRLSHAVKDHAGEARGLENLAELYRAQAKPSEAVQVLQDASGAFRRAGELEESKRLLAICAETLASKGGYDDGIEMCRAALSKPELRRRRGLFQRSLRYDGGDASLSLVLVRLLRTSGDFSGAEKEASRLLEMAESLEDQALRSKAKLESALVKESSGDLDGAVGLLAEAERLLSSIGDREGVIAMQIVLGNVEEKKGDYVQARAHYEEAARLADLIGYQSAADAAKRNIDSLDDDE